MTEAFVVYSDIRDRELLELTNSKFPIFINYINSETAKGKKEAYKIKSHWGAKVDPFVELIKDEKTIKVFYSDAGGDSAINQFINYLNG